MTEELPIEKVKIQKPRTAAKPTWGGIRDGLIAVITTSAGAAVLARTGSPELSSAASEFSGGFANLALGLSVGLGVFLRKFAQDKIAKAAQAKE